MRLVGVEEAGEVPDVLARRGHLREDAESLVVSDLMLPETSSGSPPSIDHGLDLDAMGS